MTTITIHWHMVGMIALGIGLVLLGILLRALTIMYGIGQSLRSSNI